MKLLKLENWILFIFSGLLIPAIITVILAAFEDETNLWVNQLFGADQKVSIIEKQKQLSLQGKLIQVDCGKIGMSKENLLQACGTPGYRSEVDAGDHTSSSINYILSPNQLTSYQLTNDLVVSITLTRDDWQFSSITYQEIKKYLGAPDREPIQTSISSGSNTVFSYQYDHYQLTITMDGQTNGLRSMKLEDTKLQPKRKTKSKTHSIEKYLLKEKMLEGQSGIELATSIHALLKMGDLPYNPCGKLQTTYERVIKNCGTGLQWGYNEQTNEKWNHLQSNLFEYKFSFYQDKLSYLTIIPKQRIPVDIAEIKQVMGKPKKEHKQSKKDILFDSYVKYIINGNEVLITYNQNLEVRSLQIRLPNLYDDQFGNLLPQNQ